MGTRDQGSGCLFRGGLTLLVLFVAGCASDELTEDQENIQQAIDDMQSGEFVKRIEESSEEAAKALPDTSPGDSKGSPRGVDVGEGASNKKDNSADDGEMAESSVPKSGAAGVVGEGSESGSPSTGSTVVDIPSFDPCSEVKDEGSFANGDEIKTLSKNALALADCFRDIKVGAGLTWIAYRYFKTHNGPEKNYSEMIQEEDLENLVDELTVRLETPSLVATAPEEVQSLFRSSYSDAELDELRNLAKLRQDLLREAMGLVFAAVDAKPNIFSALARATTDRYRALLALRNSIDDETGLKAAKALFTVYTGSEAPAYMSSMDHSNLYPNALTVILPEEGEEFAPLSRFHTVFDAAAWASENLSGSDEYLRQVVGLYRHFREKDNPEPVDHPDAHEDAVRVAVMDTGADFIQFPELNLYMGLGKKGQIRSRDLSDGDSNAWMPALGTLSHGTGTAATVLTVLANHYEEVLKERRIEMSYWKVWTLRNLLSGTNFGGNGWESRPNPVLEAIVDQTLLADEVLPDLVSVSLNFSFQGYISQLGLGDILTKSKWLWVMAAGNDGQDMALKKASCFEDVPSGMRPDDRILCVGALKRVTGARGEESRIIAAYSNWGQRVDVYAYQTYDKLCPNGTSCATPAITAAGAAVKARYPDLTAEQVKELIVDTAREETLDVELESPNTKSEKRTIKVFDPDSMMPELLAAADKKYG